MQFFAVLDLVVITEEWCRSYGKTEEYGTEEEADVHEYTIGGHTVQSLKMHETVVVHHAGQRMEDLTDELRCTIGEDCAEGGTCQVWASKMERDGVASVEVNERDDTTDELADNSSQRDSQYSIVDELDEYEIQENIQESGDEVDEKTDLRTLCHDEETLEYILQNEERCGSKKDPSIA